MDKTKIFENEQFGSIRTVELDGTPYFVGKDVAIVLGYKDSSDALNKKVPDSNYRICGWCGKEWNVSKQNAYRIYVCPHCRQKQAGMKQNKKS